MISDEEEQLYSIALTMVPGIGHIGAKRLVSEAGSARYVFRNRKELPELIPDINQRVCSQDWPAGYLYYRESCIRTSSRRRLLNRNRTWY